MAVSNAKLALFYDWLFFDSEKDNIMNIEPAILVMHHSMRSHPAVSATLLDFLCRIIPNFYQPLADKVRAGIFSSLRKILEKRVVPSLVPLFDNSKLDPELRNMVRETFREFCVSTNNVSGGESSTRLDENNETNDHHRLMNHQNINNHVMLDNEPVFSDDEDESQTSINLALDNNSDDDDDDDIPLSKVRLKEKFDRSDDSVIEGPVGDLLGKMQQEKSASKRCDCMEEIIRHLITFDSDDDTLPVIARSLANCIEPDFADAIFPANPTEDSLLDSIKSPLFCLFRTLYSFSNKQDEIGKATLFKLAAEMRTHRAGIGYLLIYFLKVGNPY